MSYTTSKEGLERSQTVATLVGALSSANSSSVVGIKDVQADLVKAIREQLKPLLPANGTQKD